MFDLIEYQDFSQNAWGKWIWKYLLDSVTSDIFNTSFWTKQFWQTHDHNRIPDWNWLLLHFYVSFLYKGQESQVWKLLCLQNLFFLFSFCSLFYDTRKTSRNKVATTKWGLSDFDVAFAFFYIDHYFFRHFWFFFDNQNIEIRPIVQWCFWK